ncbi:MAG: hypothetical protein ABSE95_10380, partial [Thermodesulfobacteriota bacterium]
PPLGLVLGESISTQPLVPKSILNHQEVSFNLDYLCIQTPYLFNFCGIKKGAGYSSKPILDEIDCVI